MTETTETPQHTPQVTIPKYRPTLIASEVTLLAHLLHLAKNGLLATLDMPFNTNCPTLLNATEDIVTASKKLSLLAAKIEGGFDTPAYIAKPRVSTTSLEALGEVTLVPYTLGTATYPTKEDYWKACWLAYKDTPELIPTLSTRERAAIKEHMYMTDLMTPEEDEAFMSTPSYDWH